MKLNRELRDRIRRRAGRLLRQYVPRQMHHRPTGVHASSQALAGTPGSGATYHEIVPAHVSELAVPVAYQRDASDYEGTHHRPHGQETVPAAFVLELAPGRLYADNWDSVAVIAADGWLVGDVSFQYCRQAWQTTPPEENNIFQQRYFQPPVQLAGTVCSLLSGGGAAMGNYYHWLIDSLPRLHLLRAAGLFEEVDYFLIYDQQHRFAVETLVALGIRPAQIIDVRTHPHVLAQRLLVTSPVRGTGNHTPAWACDFLRDVFLPAPPVGRAFSPYVYISRRDAQLRRVLNEAAVEAVLHPLGFETYALSTLTFAEKRALFSQARVIVGPIGAGLANLVFATPGTPVLELVPGGFVMSEHRDLAARGGLTYDWLVCASPAAAGGIFEARRLDLIVDPEALRGRVAGLLAAQSHGAGS